MNERAQNTERSEAKVLVDGERLVAYAFVRYYCGEVRASGTDLETLRALTLTNCVASELWSEQHARTARDAGNRKNLRGRRLKILTGINRVKSVGMQGQPLPMTKALSLLNRLLPLRTSSEIVKFELTSLQPADKVGSSGEHFQSRPLGSLWARSRVVVLAIAYRACVALRGSIGGYYYFPGIHRQFRFYWENRI